jgi:hypothetical protein
MNCVVCDRPANGICAFCGRALCKEHFQEKSKILDFYKTNDQKDKVLIVEKALWCSRCNPVDELLSINLDEKLEENLDQKKDA